jgi:hypothetical protein
MAYCRFSDQSDVYVYQTMEDIFECCGCIIPPKTIRRFETYDLIIEHLNTHKKLGHKVPQSAIDELIHERDFGEES